MRGRLRWMLQGHGRVATQDYSTLTNTICYLSLIHSSTLWSDPEARNAIRVAARNSSIRELGPEDNGITSLRRAVVDGRSLARSGPARLCGPRSIRRPFPELLSACTTDIDLIIEFGHGDKVPETSGFAQAARRPTVG